ncbi:SMI1/KNR4 family protein [Heyndrickxia vini]|uniref:SMI1/KNR4 family protein n=1 Tax=Heyndrickxia vini TaxID=1476025 RepID=A0ABX7E407_9BACI|nr:SMI1/KNR4 family protein [Heyndrickxia vini]QQZ10448.1 SMI1/KNR4 family protein [Heyndrickxia vini]
MQNIRKLISSRKPGVSEDCILRTEEKLGAKFPIRYRELVKLINNAEVDNWIFYPIKDENRIEKTFDDIVRANTDINNESSNNYIAFAEDGTGDQLCFKIKDEKMLEYIYFWDHENSSVEIIAKNLEEFIINLLKGDF